MRETPGDNTETAEDVFLSYVAIRPEWFARAACAGLGHAAWCPAEGESLEPARAVCAGCEVREDCRTEALKSGDTRGIWAGLSEQERRQLRKQRKLAA